MKFGLGARSGGRDEEKLAASLKIGDNKKVAGVAELADAGDSKSPGPRAHGGSTPPLGTNRVCGQELGFC